MNTYSDRYYSFNYWTPSLWDFGKIEEMHRKNRRYKVRCRTRRS